MHLISFRTTFSCTLFLAGLLVVATGMAWAEPQIYRPAVSNPCDAGWTRAERPTSQSGLNHARIRVANWNIQKSSQIGWREDLQALAENADLVLLQEAAIETNLLETLDKQSHGTFAPGYRTKALTTGVMTLSSINPVGHCALEHREPWLQSPKATVISLYPLDTGDTLLVANLHGVNFTIGATTLGQQLDDIAGQIGDHEGPMIFAGDFNTWNDARKAELERIAKQLDLERVIFSADRRIRVFGHVLDHMLVRGMTVLDSQTHTVVSSDHNPFTVTLALESAHFEATHSTAPAP